LVVVARTDRPARSTASPGIDRRGQLCSGTARIQTTLLTDRNGSVVGPGRFFWRPLA
jgi:hypothetical protein